MLLSFILHWSNTCRGWRWFSADSNRRARKIKLSNCHFFRKEVQYRGHSVSREGVATDPENISAVENWRRPRDVTEVRSFLGFCSYYRSFVKGFAQLAALLQQLVADVSSHK